MYTLSTTSNNPKLETMKCFERNNNETATYYFNQKQYYIDFFPERQN